MRTKLSGCCVAFVLMSLALTATALATGLPIVFVPPKDRSPDKVFIQFMGGSDFSAQYRDSNGALQPVSLFTAYSLTQLTNATPIGSVGANQPAVLLNSYSVGRIYISYGDNGLQDNALQQQPSADNTSDLDYYTRWQYVELTYAGTAFQINLSYIDFTSIPISIAAVNAPHATNTPQLTTVFGFQLVAAAAQGSTTPYAASLPNQTHFNSTFVRVLGSQLSSTIGATSYHDWQDYLQNFLPSKTATLNDCYIGAGNQPSADPTTQQQPYNYTVSFQSDRIVLTPLSGSGDGSGPNICVGDGNAGTGIGDSASNTITILHSDLLSTTTGVYSNNTPYTYIYNGTSHTTTGIENDIFGRIAGDVLAGLSLGIFGSTTPFNGSTVGQLSSMYWWGGKNATTVVTGQDSVGGAKLYFSGLQSNKLYYDTYAASIYNVTAGYGSPFQDRLSTNLLTLDTGVDPDASLVITITADAPPATAINDLLLLDQ